MCVWFTHLLRCVYLSEPRRRRSADLILCTERAVPSRAVWLTQLRSFAGMTHKVAQTWLTSSWASLNKQTAFNNFHLGNCSEKGKVAIKRSRANPPNSNISHYKPACGCLDGLNNKRCICILQKASPSEATRQRQFQPFSVSNSRSLFLGWESSSPLSCWPLLPPLRVRFT